MSRILMVDDSPHAQRLGERILSDEGYEVVTVSNADSALIRLDDADPDLVIADTVMPGRNGYELCQYVKMSPRHRHVRVILTAGVLEPLNEAEVQRVQADATVKKPFEASALLAAVKPLVESAQAARAEGANAPGGKDSGGKGGRIQQAPFVAVIDAEQIRAAVTIALDAAMPTMVDEITHRVMETLNPKRKEPAPLPQPVRMEPGRPAIAAVATPALKLDSVRRINPLRARTGSILGLDISRSEEEPHETQSEPPPIAKP
jgi:CheY-like chemotaxis protein